MKPTFILFIALLFPLVAATAATESSGLAFFEQKVRPVLVEHCYACHSAEAKKLKGNLYLDSKAGWEKGGDSGEPVIVPGKPEESLLIRTVQHLEDDLEMPPKKPKLPDAVIADLVTWVKMGAPDPRDGVKIEAKRGGQVVVVAAAAREAVRARQHRLASSTAPSSRRKSSR